MISIDEIRSHPEQWVDTSNLRSDGKTEYRQKKGYDNIHAIFDVGAIWGKMHYDRYNATDIPVGTVKHFSNYVEEKTNVPQGLVTLFVIIVGLVVSYKTIKWVNRSLKSL